MSAKYRAVLLAVVCGLPVNGWCLVPLADCGQAAAGASLCYTVLLESPQLQRVTMTATLNGIDPRRDALRWTMQQRFAFVRLPEPLLDEPVRATANSTPLEVERSGPYEWRAATAGCESMQLKYVVPLTHRTLDAVKQRDAYEYPYLADDHGLLVTPTLFMFPEDVDVGAIRVCFELPEGWKVVAPWRRLAEREFDPGGREALLNDLLAVGAWHVHEIRVGRFEGTVAVAPGQDDLEKAVIEPIRRIVEYELGLFGRPAEGRYLFVFGRPETSGMAGSPKTRSMTLSVEPRLASRAATHLPHLVAHEFYHTWASARFDMPDELRWLNEGFTDYYAYLVAARLNLSTWEDFANTLADKMRSCARNPSRGKLSLAEVGGEVFFRDQNAYDLAYDGGLLIGGWLDRAIRTQGGGKTLDDLMRAFINDPRWSMDTAPKLADFFVAAREFVGEATMAKLERFVMQPYDFDPTKEYPTVGVEVRHQTCLPKLDLRANLDNTRVVDVERDGLAYGVGIRPGDRLLEINGCRVAGPGEVHRAWRKPVDGRVQVTLERDGKKLTINELLPQVDEFIVSVEPWREHQ
jgi:predicted metalloprotease with PDZ domain